MDYESSAHLAPAPSYVLESSEGESDYEDAALDSAPSRVTTRRRAPAPDAEITFRGAAADRLQKGGEVVFLVGEAGERIAQGVERSAAGGGDEGVEVCVDGQQTGLICAAGGSSSLVFLSIALPLAALPVLASQLFERLQPSQVTVVASYHLPSYIPPGPSSTPTAPVLYLASPSPSPAVTKLDSQGAIQPFTPPNLLHGLAAALIAVACLSSSVAHPSTLLLLPTTAAPAPLNGPFPPTSPITTGAAAGGGSMYDAGGPTGLGEPSALFRELAGGGGSSRPVGGSRAAATAPLQAVKEVLGWDWWNPARAGGRGFEWLERQRKERRRNELSSMYM